jgi:hypothetical protein
MGVTIFYSGKLIDPATLPRLVAELQLKCGQLDWPCHLVDERILGTVEYHTYHTDTDDVVHTAVETEPIDDRWQGVIIQPPECESLFVTFNREGQLVDYDIPFAAAETPGRYVAREKFWCKTQFGTVDTHVEVCGLLRLLEPYMAEFEVIDEGTYWESGDRARLAAALDQIDQILTHLASETGRAELQEILGDEIDADNVEIGKRLERPNPTWRRDDRGVSASEN